MVQSEGRLVMVVVVGYFVSCDVLRSGADRVLVSYILFLSWFDKCIVRPRG